jgi:type IV pilus assembly protein PilQ
MKMKKEMRTMTYGRTLRVLISLAAISGALVVTSQAVFAAAKITSIGFRGTSDPNQVEIKADGPVTYEKLENNQDNQVILEIKGAQLSRAALRKIDTSSFNGKVSLISPYQVKDQPDTVRVVIQLKENTPTEVTQKGNLIRLSVAGNPGASAPPAATTAAADAPAIGSQAGGEVPVAATSPGSTKSDDVLPVDPSIAKADPAATTTNGPASSMATKLDDFMVNHDSRHFSGRPITLQVRDVDAADVFRLIGEASGFNIILGEDVKGKVTLSMTDVPWDQALDVVLHTLRLGVERNANILRVVTLANLTAEKQEELRAQRASDASAPRVTRIFPISYANLTDLQATLTKFGSSAANTSGPSGGSDTAAPISVVQIDNRTNSIIVRDLPDNIERMKKLIEVLDTQTPQVMIEAKVVEASEGFGKSMNGSLGFGGLGTNQIVASFAGGDPVQQLIGSPGVFAPAGGFGGTTASSATQTASGSIGISPSLSFIPGLDRLNAILNLGEHENQLKVISSPKMVVLNKEKAMIVEGSPVAVPGISSVAGVGAAVPTITVQQANLSLEVKPVITNDGGVMMELKISRDIPQILAGGSGFGIANRNMNTTVLVDSGSTLVIGGIYTMTTSHTSSGFPILRKLPIIGALFGNELDSTERSELFIFITPRILNVKEGISG